MKETYELIKPIVDSLPKTIKVSSVTDNLDGTFTITTCNTLHLQASNRVITIDGNPYTVKEVFHNSVIILEGQTLPDVTEFDIYPIKFFHGTIKTTNIELNQVDTSEDKFPMVYLYEVLEEENSHNVSELTGRTVDVRLYFLTENDWRNLNSKERQDLGVKPMRNAFDAFMRLLETSDVCTDVPDLSRTRPYGVFGRENEQGIFKTIFDADLSGLGVRMVIPFKRVYCECSDFSEYFFQFINEGGNQAKQFICQTLPECQTIQQIESTLENHEERIEALEDNPGGGLTCETVLECQNVIDAFDGKVDKETGKGLSENDFTTTLKNAYDAAVQWIIDNGTNLLKHLSNTNNPHATTAAQVGAVSLKYKTIQSSVNVFHTGTLTPTVINSFIIPANTFENGDFINLFYYVGRAASNTSNATFDILFNGQLAGTIVVATTARQLRGNLMIINPDSTGVLPQILFPNISWTTGSVNGSNNSMNVDFTANVTVELRATLGTISDTFILRGLRIEK
jgi:hypothetical protein